MLSLLQVHVSHLYTTTGKTMTMWTFVGKVMSLLLNMLSRFIISFLPKSKRLLISWLQSLSMVILEPQICHCFHFFPIYLDNLKIKSVICLIFILFFHIVGFGLYH